MNRSTRDEYPLAAYPGRSIDGLVQLGGYEYFNPLINNGNFSASQVSGRAEVVCFGERRQSSDMPRRLESMGRRPGSMSDLLELRVQYPELSLADPILALGAVYINAERQRYIGCIFEFADEPNLEVIWEREVWSPCYRFLVIA